MRRARLVALLVVAALAWWLLARTPRTPPEPSRIPTAVMATEANTQDEFGAADARIGARESLVPDSGVASHAESGARSASLTLVRGRVLFSDTHEPVHRGSAALTFSTGRAIVDRELRNPAVAPVDDHGRFELHLPEGLGLEWIKLEPAPSAAVDASYPRAMADEFVPKEQPIDRRLQANGLDLEVLVERGRSLAGIVVDALTRAPLANASVESVSLGRCMRTQTGIDGTFRIVAVSRGAESSPPILVVDEPEHVSRSVQLARRDLEPGAPPLEIELDRGLTLAGRVVDELHQPVPQARLLLALHGSGLEVEPSAPVHLNTIADEAGEFRFGGIAPGSLAVLSLDTQGFPTPRHVARTRVVGTLDEDRRDVEFSVAQATEVRVLTERTDGSSVVDYQFRVSSPGSEPWSAGGSSSARVALLPAGTTVQIDAFAPVEDPSDTADLSRSEVVLRGSVSIQVERARASPQIVHVVLNETVRFALPRPPPNCAEIYLWGSHEMTSAIDVQLLDASDGQPLAAGLRGCFSLPDLNERFELSAGAWLRLSAPPGEYAAVLSLDGQRSQAFSYSIPSTGYASTQWRVEKKR